MTNQLFIEKGKHTFHVGDYVRVKPHSETEFIGQIMKIDGNVLGISVGGSFYYNYHIKQIFKPNKIKL